MGDGHLVGVANCVNRLRGGTAALRGLAPAGKILDARASTKVANMQARSVGLPVNFDACVILLPVAADLCV